MLYPFILFLLSFLFIIYIIPFAITLKNNIDKEDNTSKKETSTKIQKTKSNIETISNLNLPGINEDNLVNINGKDYIKSDN